MNHRTNILSNSHRLQTSSWLRGRARRLDESRRGVLLLVVLSMLVLFMLVGTTFLITGSQYRTTSKVAEKANRAPIQADPLLNRALMQILRDTNNPRSAIRTHSLLNDIYGTDGFVGTAYAGVSNHTQNNRFIDPGTGFSNLLPALTSRYAEATGGNDLVGPTQGQLIDIYIQDDCGAERTYTNESAAIFNGNVQNQAIPTNPEPEFLIDLDLDENGLRKNHALNKTSGYYNGCILTVLEGPASGQSTRVLQYDFLPAADPNGVGVGRFRVLVFSRRDGGALQLGIAPAGSPIGQANDLIYQRDTDGVAGISINDANFGRQLMVNGRPYNGTGVGLNQVALPGTPQLTAMEAIELADNSIGFIGIETALTPNAIYYNAANAAAFQGNPGAAFAGTTNTDLFSLYETLGFGNAYSQYVGPGGADESYDAPDFQNLFLAWQSATPRERARLLDSNGNVQPLEAYNGLNAPQQLLLEDVPIPSFHRPALVNFWMHRLYNAPWLVAALPDEAQRIRAILQPYGQDMTPDTPGGPQADDNAPLPIASTILAVKRKIMLRPLPEDHPDFDGSNPLSQPDGNLAPSNIANANSFLFGGEITFPTWETTGPWDVDNDGDGVPDSIWVDLGEPVRKTEDGRFYKPLYAILIQDLDNRLNLNAHGTSEHFVDSQLDGSIDLESGTLARLNLAGEQWSSNQMPQGIGFGPAEVSLRPVMSPRLVDPSFTLAGIGDPTVDDYARLFGGRPLTPNQNQVPASLRVASQWGRYGSRNLGVSSLANPGISLDFAVPTSVDRRAQIEFFGYPKFLGEAFAVNKDATFDPGAAPFTNNLAPYRPSGFAQVPDMRGAYGIGIDYSGQAIVESAVDYHGATGTTANGPQTALVYESPYEADLTNTSRRGEPGIVNTPSDDALFSAAELERLLRPFDADVGRVPNRLWDVVDAFDPNKLVQQQNSLGTNAAPTPGQLAAAQLQAAVNRRSVTTDSMDVPAVSSDWAGRIVLGLDGQPGTAGVDDDGNGIVDDASEIGWFDDSDPSAVLYSDDYSAIMSIIPGIDPEPPTNPGLVDYLRYRVLVELLRKNIVVPTAQLTGATAANNLQFVESLINQVINGNDSIASQLVRESYYSFGGLVAPEVLAGMKMNLNRPFGDGRDNNGNGIVDEPAEAGEPYIDLNRNGVWDDEPYLDLDADGRFYADVNNDRVFNAADVQQVDVDSNSGPVLEPAAVDTLWGEVGIGPYLFQHTGGRDANGRGTLAGGGIVNDDGPMARQLYARHLYCLMLALMDEKYLTPYDPADPQVRNYIDPKASGVSGKPETQSMAYQLVQAGLSENEARELAMRKLTCRHIAQWAINVVDMRDPDAICTPFEYDENPWDGWNCIGGRRTGILPIDGDLTTDENMGHYVQVTAAGWNQNLPTGSPLDILEQTRGVVWGAERPELLITETLAVHDRRVEIADGDEEGEGGGGNNIGGGGDLLGGGRRGAQNVLQQNIGGGGDQVGQGGDRLGGGGDILGGGGNGAGGGGTAGGLIQRLRPQGSVFVEIYNPWSEDTDLPAELYTSFDKNDIDGDGETNERMPAGIDLQKLSDGTFDDRRSPVWRLIAIEEHPEYRNNDSEARVSDDNIPGAIQFSSASGGLLPNRGNQRSDLSGGFAGVWQDRKDGKIPWQRLLDPDFPSFDQLASPDSGNRPNTPLKIDQQGYVERAFYFTRGATDFVQRTRDNEPVPSLNAEAIHPNAYVRIPELVTKYAGITLPRPTPNPSLNGEPDEFSREGLAKRGIRRGGGGPFFGGYEVSRSSFVPTMGSGASTIDMPIAPILPGRYAVIGSTGYEYDSPNFEGRYISPLGRRFAEVKKDGQGGEQGDFPLLDAKTVEDTRRIELVPSADPNKHQVLFDDNGGYESQLMAVDPRGDATFVKNVTDTDPNIASTDLKVAPRFRSLPSNLTDGPDADSSDDLLESNTDQRLANFNIKPAIAVPIEGMTLSEPVDGYISRRDALQQANGEDFSAHRFSPKGVLGEGEYAAQGDKGSEPAPYSGVFDTIAASSVPTQQEIETPRTLSNYRALHLQRLANPLLVWNPEPGKEGHEPSLPVNPYLTIDSMGADLTIYNGTFTPTQPPERTLNQKMQQFATAASNQRGWLGRNASRLPNGAGDGLEQPLRMLWAQEPPRQIEHASRLADELRPNAPISERRTYSSNTGFTVSGVKFEVLDDNGQSVTATYGRPLDPPADDSLPQPEAHVLNYAFDHSLGFANRPLTQDANGAPGIQLSRHIDGTDNYFEDDGSNETSLENSTYRLDKNGDASPGDIIGLPRTDGNRGPTFPWFAWNNRPFANTGELLQTPAFSSSKLLRYYSVMNPTVVDQPNPYAASLLADADGNQVNGANEADEEATNRARFKAERGHFGHLMNFFQSSSAPAAVGLGTNSKTLAVGAPNFNRLFDYVHVPSRYIGTDTFMNPDVFNSSAVVDPSDPRRPFLPPYNLVSTQREPGRVNLNTVSGRRVNTTAGFVSTVYDGLMHSVNNGSQRNPDGSLKLSHLGPAWRDVVLSRRGYLPIGTVNLSDFNTRSNQVLNSAIPTFFANPFRNAGAAELVPLQDMLRSSAEATLYRSHPIAPAALDPAVASTPDGFAWGLANVDDDGNGIVDDQREAGLSMDDVPAVALADFANTPLFSDTAPDPALSGDRNPAIQYSPMQRLSSMTTTRSGVFAIWITVGFFEVTPAPEWTGDNQAAVRASFGGGDMGGPRDIVAREAYDRVYPEGYQLGEELGSDTGETTRYRAFYMVDRTIPVGFRPGDDTNVERALLVRRRIE